jgi:hypothetical protein
MIGKIGTGKSFRGCLSYLHDGRMQPNKELQQLEMEKKQAQVVFYNQCFGNKKELIKQFNEVRNLNPKLSKPVFHTALSFAYEDANKLNLQDKADIATALATDFGFDKNQYVVIAHGDTKHEHLHIVGNRVGYDGRTASDSNSFKRMARFCRRMEQAYQLTVVLSPNKFLPSKLRVNEVFRKDIRKEMLKQHLNEAINTARTIADVKKIMQAKGYAVELGRGIAFTDQQKVRFKGSQVGFALADIEKKLKQINRPQHKLSLAEQLRQVIKLNEKEPIQQEVTGYTTELRRNEQQTNEDNDRGWSR